MVQWFIELLKMLSGFIIQTLSKWLFGVIGTFLVTWGIDNPEDVVYKVVGGLVGLAIAFLIDLMQHKRALHTEPPKKLL